VILSDTGESRVRGYLYVLERSLVLALPRDVAQDAVREIESHLRERIAAVLPSSDERGALEQILAELGPPLRVAQAYSTERAIDEAVVTGRLVPILRALWQAAVTSVVGFFAALGILVGYALGGGFMVLGILKPIFPSYVGFWGAGPFGMPTSFGVKNAPEGPPMGGNWVILIGLGFGLLFLVLTHRGAKRFLVWFRGRRIKSAS
jgi:uncharacterized membrane protein